MRLLQTLRLTDYQKIVLAKIVDAPTPKIAAQSITGDPNLSTATKQLADLDLIDYSPMRATVKPKGAEMMKDDNLIDVGNQLTDTGHQLAAVGKATRKDTEEMNQRNQNFEGFKLLGQLVD